MRILVTSFGTRGDIQPYVALVKALRGHGHDATLAVPEAFRGLADQHGVPLQAAGSAMFELVQEVLPELSGARDALKTFAVMKEAMAAHLTEIEDAVRATAAELIVYHPKCLAAPHLAEALDARGVLSMPLPFYTPTQDFPVPFFGHRSLGRLGNRASYAVNRLGTVTYGGVINDFRRQLGLRPTGRFSDPLRNPDGSPVEVLYPFSSHVVPIPADYPPTAHVTGYWFLDEPDWQPPERLVDFLGAGAPPVYLGFGSMGFGKGADERRDAILGALRANRLRGIVATGWGGISPGDSSDDVLVIDDAPHEWLFPKVAAVVHHGGAGSTAAGLRAGRPTLICPFLGDQPFWGARVHALGAGPQPLRPRQLSTRLGQRLAELVGDPRYRRRAAEVGALIRSQDGPASAVATLERLG